MLKAGREGALTTDLLFVKICYDFPKVIILYIPTITRYYLFLSTCRHCCQSLLIKKCGQTIIILCPIFCILILYVTSPYIQPNIWKRSQKKFQGTTCSIENIFLQTRHNYGCLRIQIHLLQIHRARRFYENIVPSYTVYDVECPDHSFRKFTDDGLYLVSFSRNHQDLIVYRPTWLSFSCKDEDCDIHDLPSKARKFESFFTQLYSVTLASSGELICKDFFLYMESNQFGLFATSTAQIHDAPPTGGAIQGVPSVEKITFHLLRCVISPNYEFH